MSETATVRVYALGPFRIETPAGVKERLPTRKATALLAQLALDPRPHSRQSLQVEYWPDDAPDRARTSLRQALSNLTKMLQRRLVFKGNSVRSVCLRLLGSGLNRRCATNFQRAPNGLKTWTAAARALQPRRPPLLQT